MLPAWLSSLFARSETPNQRLIRHLEARVTYYESLFRDVTSAHLQGLHMPGVNAPEPKEFPVLRGKLLPTQYRRAAEAQDRKNHEEKNAPA